MVFYVADPLILVSIGFGTSGQMRDELTIGPWSMTVNRIRKGDFNVHESFRNYLYAIEAFSELQLKNFFVSFSTYNWLTFESFHDILFWLSEEIELKVDYSVTILDIEKGFFQPNRERTGKKRVGAFFDFVLCTDEESDKVKNYRFLETCSMDFMKIKIFGYL